MLQAGGPAEDDDARFRRIERLRFVDPRAADESALVLRDRESLLLPELMDTREAVRRFGLVGAWQRTSLCDPDRPVYFLSWEGEEAGQGEVVYRDEHVVISEITVDCLP